jgi:glucose/arabinose dehydrogenase
MRRLGLLPAILALLVTACGDTPGQPAIKTAGLELVRIGTFADPVYVTSPPGDDRLFVVEQAGRIRVLDGGTQRTFLDIRPLVTSGGEQGLLGLAFAPDYARSRRFYVYYTDRDGNQRVVEYRAASADRADPGSARLVLAMADSESNHNGGMLLFGPDGRLYIGTGDGGGGGDEHGAHGNAQDRQSLLGKILRMDDPATPGARPEVFAYGLRNPWRFTFDAQTDDLVIGDVGQDEVEEIDYVHDGAGANFGWRVYEGDRRYHRGESAPGAVGPVMTFRHSDGNCSITGGVVVRDRAVPAAYGRYLFGDYCKGDILSARLKLPRSTAQRTGLEVDSLSSFGEDARGRVYVVSLDGPVYRLAAA